MGITLNTVARDEHVPEVERYIRTIKERARSTYSMLPFTRMPARMTIELIYASVFWLNTFPATDGVSDTLSPRELIVGLKIDYNRHCRVEYGTYVQVHEETDNSLKSRTTGAIALRPTGNAQGGFYFYSLTSGRRLNRNRWTTLPLPADVIDRVHFLARRGRCPNGIDFLDRARQPLIDEHDVNARNEDDGSMDSEDNHTYASTDFGGDDDDLSDANGDLAAVIAAADDPDDAAGYLAGVDEDADNNEAYQADHDAPDLRLAGVVDIPPNDDDTDNNRLDPNVVNDDDTDNNRLDPNVVPPNHDNPLTYAEVAALRYGPRTDVYNLRPQRPRDYGHLHTSLEHSVMTQHNMKTGLKLFGEAGTDAVIKELRQLHEREALEPKNPDYMTKEEKRGALPYLMFLKQKRNGTIKGRGCADGRRQRVFTAKEEASSPTVATESVFLSCTVDAMERRDVGIVDIPNAFLQGEMDEDDVVYMRLDGTLADLLVKLDPARYELHARQVNGKTVIYARLRKPLYGTLKAALLFWKRLSSELAKKGFVANPYDPCVVNKSINGHQCTILWHVDDLKISHVDPNVVSAVIADLEKEFGQEAPLTVTRGKVHEYLGMTLDYQTPGKVKITMVNYIKDMLRELPTDMDGESITPAGNHLFQVNESNPELLDEATSDFYHHNTAKLLYLCKRARPDIQTAVAFLCTRVNQPDRDDYKKLGRVMRYLRGSLHMPLTLEATQTNIIKWWVDASFAVHPDMRSHTGGVMTLGRGAVYSTSTRQKINTRSSTESELVAVNDVMPQILWTRRFLDAQGYGSTDSIIYQDNQSCMLLAKNGRASSSKRTRHIDIRYFFVTDRIASGDVSVAYCPTADMIADFFTKPLQGAPFRQFRDFIMNIDPDYTAAPAMNPRSVLRIENHENTIKIKEFQTKTNKINKI